MRIETVIFEFNLLPSLPAATQFMFPIFFVDCTDASTEKIMTTSFKSMMTVICSLLFSFTRTISIPKAIR